MAQVTILLTLTARELTKESAFGSDLYILCYRTRFGKGCDYPTLTNYIPKVALDLDTKSAIIAEMLRTLTLPFPNLDRKA